MNHNNLLHIGIDVSKDKHDICIKSNDGNVLKRFQIKKHQQRSQQTLHNSR